MPEGWQWDSTRFQGSATYYERGRLPYAPGFAETLATVLGLDGRGRLLDVGCGPGIVLLALAAISPRRSAWTRTRACWPRPSARPGVAG